MGLDNIGGWELIVIVLVGLFIFGPDKLPKAISDGLRMLRTVRDMARNATGDLSRELGTTVELEDLNPKTFLRKHLLSEEDEQALRKPLQGIYDEVRGVADGVREDVKQVTESVKGVAESAAPASTPAIARRSYDDVT
jgi:sec-independent protein translocase protein TatB